jgi:hypothetical protein
MTTIEYLLYGLKATITHEGISITGSTYNNRELLKKLGAKWSSVDKAWKLPYGTDLADLRPPPPPPQPQRPKFLPLPSHAIRGGRCCTRAVARFDDENPQGPLWYVCPMHGTYKSCYTGD